MAVTVTWNSRELAKNREYITVSFDDICNKQLKVIY